MYVVKEIDKNVRTGVGSREEDLCVYEGDRLKCPGVYVWREIDKTLRESLYGLSECVCT